MKERGIIAILLALAMCFTGCARGSAQEQTQSKTVSFVDDAGRLVELEPPQRVTVMIGSFADMWCLAGGKDSLVAAANDTWTSFSLDLDESVMNIGDVSSPSLEKIIYSEPELVLASCNTQADVNLMDSFEQAGITAAYFDVKTFEDYLRVLKICTELTGCTENYEMYGEKLQQQVASAIEMQNGEQPSVLYIRATGTSCKVKSSSGSVLGEMLKDLGCINVADSDENLLENLSLEAIMKAEPEYIFVVLQGADTAKAQAMLEKTLLSNPAWSELEAVRESRYYVLDGKLYNLKPNARWGEAYEKLAEILYK